MKKLILLSILLIAGCSLGVDYMPISHQAYEAKPSDHFIHVFELREDISEYKLIGKVGIGEAGMTVECGYTDVIKKAQEKAREVGGDAIQILELKTPSGGTCYHLFASILIKI